MKILIVAASKKCGVSPFVTEQKGALVAAGVEVAEYAHGAHGIRRYLREVPKLRREIKRLKPDVVHAHFGLTGLMVGLAALGTGVPVVVTYHGCDINDKKLRPFSRIAMRLAMWNVFVSKRQMINAYGSESKVERAKRSSIIPCGINIEQFDDKYVDNGWFDSKFGEGDKVLFAGSFESYVKNPELARQAVERLAISDERLANVELIEMKGFTREEVVTLMYRCKALLLTSIREGSPQVVKEAMTCGCPIVSVDVGDVAERLNGLDGCYVVPSREPKDIAEALQKAIAFGRTKGRDRLRADKLDNAQIAERLIAIYQDVTKKD